MTLNQVSNSSQVHIEQHAQASQVNLGNVAAFIAVANQMQHTMSVALELENDIDIIAILMKYKGPSPVLAAARNNDVSAVKLLLARGADVQKALEGAIQGKSLSLVKYLVEDGGARIDILSPNNRIPYFEVLYQSVGWWEGFDYFISRGARIPSEGGAMMFQVIFNLTALENSKFCGDDLYQLYKRGCKIRWDDSFHARLYNSIFESQKRIDIIENLIKCDMGLSVAETKFHVFPDPDYPNWGKKIGVNKRECTPLLFAVARNDLALVEVLLRAGAHTELVVQKGYTPLNIAINEGNREIVELLIKYGAIP